LESNHKQYDDGKDRNPNRHCGKCVLPADLPTRRKTQHHQHHIYSLRREQQHVQHSTRIVPEKVYEFREPGVIGFQTAQLMWLEQEQSAVSTPEKAPSKKSISRSQPQNAQGEGSHLLWRRSHAGRQKVAGLRRARSSPWKSW